MSFKKARIITATAFSGSLLMGCAPMQYPSYYSQQDYNAAYQNYAPAQAPAAPAPEPVQQPQYVTSPRVTAELNGLQERVRRVERAMIRLDRRMQLIERNELSRMSSEHMSGEGTAPVSGMFQPMSYKDEGNTSGATSLPYGAGLTPTQSAPVKMPSLGGASSMNTPARMMPFQRNATLQQVSMNTNPGLITSSLQVAPKTVAYNGSSSYEKGSSPRLSGLPSLADKKDEPKTDSVFIWTIRYEDEKIWPERSELKDSGSVIQALRAGEPVALFARGARPASKEFRERVRAVSKYLSKVSEVENVPIASMPAKYLDEDTIEILATK